MRKPRGYTLIELMIVVALIAIVASIAVPLYTDYIDSAHTARLLDAMDSMRIFQEDLRLRTGAYGGGTIDPPTATNTLTPAIGWQPSGDDNTKYVVTANAGISWTVTATDLDSGHAETRTFTP
jgi:type IV pilus assembly protein PilE